MKIMSLLTVSLLFLPITGCSIYSAAHAPKPVNFREVRVGQERTDVFTTLGLPRMTETTAENRKDYHEFTDGYHQAWKGRMLVYLAGDIFTIGLSEIIFWPLEELTLQGSTGRAYVEYGVDNKVKSIKVVSAKLGELWYEDPIDFRVGDADLVPYQSPEKSADAARLIDGNSLYCPAARNPLFHD